jgi:hypothetical protein
VPDLEGDVVRQLDGLTLIDLGPASAQPRPPVAWVLVMTLAWAGFSGLLALGLARAVLLRRRSGA